jgi:hypothetical protein
VRVTCGSFLLDAVVLWCFVERTWSPRVEGSLVHRCVGFVVCTTEQRILWCFVEGAWCPRLEDPLVHRCVNLAFCTTEQMILVLFWRHVFIVSDGHDQRHHVRWGNYFLWCGGLLLKQFDVQEWKIHWFIVASESWFAHQRNGNATHSSCIPSSDETVSEIAWFVYGS